MEPGYLWRLSVAFGTLAGVAASIAQHRTDRAATPSLSRHPSYDTVAVASVGNRILTGQEFLLNYEFGPAFPKRGPMAKRRYLEFMINEKLLALDGYAMGLDRAANARNMLDEIEGDLITEQLYRNDVARGVNVTEPELDAGIRRERIHLTVEWLYEADEEAIMRKYRLIRSGTAFDTLFAAQLNDSVTRDDRSMETTLFRLFQKNPSLASVVDTLRTGGVARPIKAPDGWYLVANKERSADALLTESEAGKLREDVRRALVQQRSDSLSDRYVDRLMNGRRPTIQRRAFDILEAHLALRILPPEKAAAWGVKERLHSRWGVASSPDLGREALTPLVTFGKQAFTIGDFLKWYNAREAYLKLRTQAAAAFFSSLEECVWRMVRDKLLVERARQRGYQRLPDVRRYKQWWQDKFVYTLRKNMIADSISLTADELQRYYAEHRRDYRADDGTVRPYEKAADDVRRDYYNDELTRRMLHRLVALKQRYGVTIHDETLNALPVEAENDPKTIDVYAVKKGGTFPHRAFPSIDYEWQRWE